MKTKVIMERRKGEKMKYESNLDRQRRKFEELVSDARKIVKKELDNDPEYQKTKSFVNILRDKRNDNG